MKTAAPSTSGRYNHVSMFEIISALSVSGPRSMLTGFLSCFQGTRLLLQGEGWDGQTEQSHGEDLRAEESWIFVSKRATRHRTQHCCSTQHDASDRRAYEKMPRCCRRRPEASYLWVLASDSSCPHLMSENQRLTYDQNHQASLMPNQHLAK